MAARLSSLRASGGVAMAPTASAPFGRPGLPLGNGLPRVFIAFLRALGSANGIEHRSAVGLLDDHRARASADELFGQGKSRARSERNFAASDFDGEIVCHYGIGRHSERLNRIQRIQRRGVLWLTKAVLLLAQDFSYAIRSNGQSGAGYFLHQPPLGAYLFGHPSVSGEATRDVPSL